MTSPLALLLLLAASLPAAQTKVVIEPIAPVSPSLGAAGSAPRADLSRQPPTLAPALSSPVPLVRALPEASPAGSLPLAAPAAAPAQAVPEAARPAREAVGGIEKGADAGSSLDALYLGAKPAAQGEAVSAGSLDRAQVSLQKNHDAFTRSRGLAQYRRLFDGVGDGPLARELERLKGKPDAQWLDSGGGEGFATAELMRQPGYEKLSTTIISYQTGAQEGPGRRVLSGRFLQDIPASELPKADLITDAIGILAYTYDLGGDLQKLLSSLKEDGTLLVYLGTSIRDFYGHHNKVVVGGRRMELAEFLTTLPGVRGELIKTPLRDNAGDLIGEAWNARLTRVPGEAPRVPGLETVYFREADKRQGEIVPERIFAGKDAARTGAPTREAEEAFARAPASAQDLFEAFRTGALTHPLLAALSGLRAGDEWVDLGPASGEEPVFDRKHFLAASQKLMTLRAKAARLGRLKRSKALGTRRSARVITDYYGPFLSGYEPDRQLARYLDALRDDGELYLYLGLEDGGAGTEARVLTKDGRKLGLRAWLRSIPGLAVTESRGHRVIDHGGRWVHEEPVFVRVRLKDRAQARVPGLELLGAGGLSAEGAPVALFRER